MTGRNATIVEPRKKTIDDFTHRSSTTAGSFSMARKEIEKLISLHELDLAMHEEAIRNARAKLTELRDIRDKLGSISKGKDRPVPENFAKRQRNRAGSLAWTIRREAYVAIKEAGHPLNRREILDHLTANGLLEGRPDAAKVVGKTLWAADEFASLERGYWLADEPIPEGEDLPARPKRKWAKKRSGT